MTVYKVVRSKRGSTGNRPLDGFPSFSLEYDLWSDSADEQQASIITQFEGIVISRGQPYTTGLYGTLDPSQAAICTNIRARWDELSCRPWIWQVTAEFQGNQFGQNITEPDVPAGQPPEEWNLEFSTGSQALREERVYSAYHMGGLSFGTNEFKRIQNATGAFEGEPIYDTFQGEFMRVQMDLPNFNLDQQRPFYDRVNNAALSIAGLRNFTATYAQYTLKLLEVTCDMIGVKRDIESGAPADVKYRVSWLFQHDPSGHVRTRDNAGTYYLNGGKYYRFLDCDGVEYDDAQPLDVNGNALADNLSLTCPTAKPFHLPPVDRSDWIEIQWRTEEAKDLRNIPYAGKIFAP
jgi:hypothetical protein